MENQLVFELKQQLANIDIDSIKLDAIIHLKLWQKKINVLIENIYMSRLNEIDRILLNLKCEIDEKTYQLEHVKNDDKKYLIKLQHDIDQLLSSNIFIRDTVPENFHRFIERTIRVCNDENSENDDDDFVFIDVDKDENKIEDILSKTIKSDSCVMKVLTSEPVQQALAASLAKTLTHVGTAAITSTTTIAATTMAKSLLLSTACGISAIAFSMGRIVLDATKNVWTLARSTDY